MDFKPVVKSEADLHSLKFQLYWMRLLRQAREENLKMFSIFCTGKEGKQFWGRNHTVMEGDNITLVCHSQPKAGRTYTWYYWHVRERQFGTQKYGESALLLKFVGWKKPKYTRNFGIMQSLIKGTRDIQLRNVGRYATGIYTCGVETLMQRKPKREYYSEYTYRKVTVQCKYMFWPRGLKV